MVRGERYGEYGEFFPSGRAGTGSTVDFSSGRGDTGSMVNFSSGQVGSGSTGFPAPYRPAKTPYRDNTSVD
jgi:hypothetical protein